MTLNEEWQNRDGENRFQRLFETAKDGIVVMEAETETVLEVNPYFLQATGLERGRIVSKKLTDAEPFRRLPQAAGLISLLKARETVRYDDLPIHKGDGGTINMDLVASLCQVGTQTLVQLNLRDVTARKEQEEDLRRAAEDKALLVREIHHRVKNNLQVIVSLLSLQARYTSDPKAVAGFQEMEARVRAIAHIHETLYATHDLAQIEFAAYLKNLVRELLTVHATVKDGVELDLQMEEIVLEMEQAIPLGLIANELIINSLKHGMRQGRGKLSIRLKYKRDPELPTRGEALDSGWAQLDVSDDGPGLRGGIELEHVQSMGFRLLNLLTKQVQGQVVFSRGKGATVCVEFPLTVAQ